MKLACYIRKNSHTKICKKKKEKRRQCNIIIIVYIEEVLL